MGEQVKPDASPGWYSDPDQADTQRYWDGSAWTDQRAPVVRQVQGLNASNQFVVGLVLAGLGAAVAIVGVFLPLADTESSIHIAKNSMIQHWEGGVVIGVAVLGFLAALWSSLRPLAFLTGAVLIAVAVVSGTTLPIEYRNEFSETVAGDASPGAGIWSVGVGGALMAVAAFFSDWGAFSGRISVDEGRKRRWNEYMSGEFREEEEENTSPEATDKAS